MTDTPVTLARASVGTSGFSYPSWRPGFYPSELRPADFLRHYAEHLPSVELNTTGYRLPAEEHFDRWAEAVPADFRFAVKLSGRGFREVETFESRVGRLGARLGPIRAVLQQARDDGFLSYFLGSIDPALRYAFDFRHPSWSAPEVDALLAGAGAGAVRVGALEAEAPFRYLRLREPPYDDAALADWAARIAPLVAEGVEVFCYFKHEDEPTAPRYALRLLELLGGRPQQPRPTVSA